MGSCTVCRKKTKKSRRKPSNYCSEHWDYENSKPKINLGKPTVKKFPPSISQTLHIRKRQVKGKVGLNHEGVYVEGTTDVGDFEAGGRLYSSGGRPVLRKKSEEKKKEKKSD